MNVLILGGTGFVGRHIAQALLRDAHTVAVFNRGASTDALPACVTRLRGDRDTGHDGLRSLAGGSWDACIDVCGYTPRQVRPSAELLARRIGRYVYISAVRVYGDPAQRPVRETHPRLPPADERITAIDGDTYGPLKVACENMVEAIYGERSAVLRPQIVAGPHDPLDRYSYWVRRAAQGGEMLAPGDGRDHLQVIDARDLARFVVLTIERGLSGAFNLAGPRLKWADFLTILGADNLVWVSAELLRTARVTEFELPLYRPERGPASSLMDVCNQRAVAAGLTLTSPAVTAADTRAWLPACRLAPALTPLRERALIALSRAQATR